MIDPEFVLRMRDRLDHRAPPSRRGKNRMRLASKLSKKQLRELAVAFGLDKQPQEVARETGLALKTVYRKFSEIRYVFAEGARYRTDMFGGAGCLLFIGVPPVDIRERVLAYKEDRRIKKRLNYVELFERLVRIYARWPLSQELQAAALIVSLWRAVKSDPSPYRLNALDFLRVHGRFAVIEKNWRIDPESDPQIMELWKMVRETPQRSSLSYDQLLRRDLRWLLDRCPLAVPAPQWRLENRESAPNSDRMTAVLARLRAAVCAPASAK